MFEDSNSKISVLFVCMGNICRSPTAHGVFASLVDSNNLTDKISVDSAGTHAYHIGSQPDQRAQQTALKNDIDLSSLVARKVLAQDFVNFDYIIAMDKDNLMNLEDVQQQASTNNKASLHLFMEFAPNWVNTEVPDPYYGGDQGFKEVFEMIEDAAKGLLEEINKKI